MCDSPVCSLRLKVTKCQGRKLSYRLQPGDSDLLTQAFIFHEKGDHITVGWGGGQCLLQDEDK